MRKYLLKKELDGIAVEFLFTYLQGLKPGALLPCYEGLKPSKVIFDKGGLKIVRLPKIAKFKNPWDSNCAEYFAQFESEAKGYYYEIAGYYEKRIDKFGYVSESDFNCSGVDLNCSFDNPSRVKETRLWRSMLDARENMARGRVWDTPSDKSNYYKIGG